MPTPPSNDIFISYSRRDSAFVQKLVQAFMDHERDVWVDFEDIPFGTDWWQEIVDGIDSAAACIFVVSPDSMRSQVCSLEVNHMIKSKKRIIPIAFNHDTHDTASDQKVPALIMNLNWLFFDPSQPFEQAFKNLLTTIDTDIQAERERARLLTKAREWDDQGNDPSFLLRGEELRRYLPLLANSDKLSDLQSRYLRRSQQYHDSLQLLLRFGWGFVGGVLGMAYFIAQTFRVDTLFSPVPIAIAIAAGEIFGLFIGVIAAISYGLPLRLRQFVPPPLRDSTRAILALAFGISAWVVFQWFFLSLPLEIGTTNFIGGVGLAFGFIVAIFTRLPVLGTTALTALATFIPIYLLNSRSEFEPIRNGTLEPLVYFDSATAVWQVGLPMALFIAVGANAPQLWQALRPYIIRNKPVIE